MTAILFLFPPTFSILSFAPKLAVVPMYATAYLVLVPTSLSLQNFSPSGLDLIVTVLLSVSVLYITPLTLMTM